MTKFYSKILNNKSPYIIAEIGANHNGNLLLAKKLIKKAKISGADCVKFQSWTSKSLFSSTFFKNKKLILNEINKFHTSERLLLQLRSYAKKLNIDFSSSVFSKFETDFLLKLNVPFIKIASMDINNLDLIEYVSKTNKTIVISTGLSSAKEIENAVKTIEKTKNNKIIILHCVSKYPPNDIDINLSKIETLKKMYHYPIGFSDHSIGTSIPLASVMLGVKVIEKHFTLDKKLKGWDHAISANPDELKFLTHETKRIARAIGRKELRRVESLTMLKNFRRSCVASIDLKVGDKLDKSKISFKRPGTGIPPDNLSDIIGKVVKKAIKKDEIISLKKLS